MSYIVGMLILVVIILLIYCSYVQRQVRSMSKQLEKRLQEGSRQPLCLDLFNPGLNKLAINMNQCIQAEEHLRLDSVKEEKQFKEMITNISHDLRTPLTAIKGYQQMLAKSNLTKEQGDKLSIAQKHTEELGQLVERFFEYSYLLNTEKDVTLECFNLTNLVAECMVAAIPAFEEQQLELRYEEPAPIFINADKERVTRILNNLLRNSLQHAKGFLAVHINADKAAVVIFQNPLELGAEIDVERIFERFYTGDSTRSHSTGLGLSIVKLLAEQMNGSVSAKLEDGMIQIIVSLSLAED